MKTTFIEDQIQDAKYRNLIKGDLVVLVEARDLDNDDLIHNAGDIFQFVGGMDDNIGCFIHCKTNKGTNFFADRTFKIVKQTK
jgi:predicted TPR repeat methyltransferase